MSDIDPILTRCENIWRQQSIGDPAIHEMRTEIESHLRDAHAAGKPSYAVVGGNVDDFARSWAEAHAPHSLPASFYSSEPTERTLEARRTRTRLLGAIAAIVLVGLIGLLIGPRGSSPDIEMFQWIFIGSFFVLLIGEMFTGGFFVLPFAIGSLVAAVLSFAEIDPPVLIVVFIITSILGLWGLREFASKDDDILVNVGANRYIDRHAVVTEAIVGIAGVGRVRIDTESWLAVTDGNEIVEPGTLVRVQEVRGARLVVSQD